MITPAQTLAGVSEEGLLGSIFPFLHGRSRACSWARGTTPPSSPLRARWSPRPTRWCAGATGSTSGPARSDVGAKVAAQNLADVAAMGAVPARRCSSPSSPTRPRRWPGRVDFAAAVGEAALRRPGSPVVGRRPVVRAAGGRSSSRSPPWGTSQGRAPVLRSGARAGRRRRRLRHARPLGRGTAPAGGGRRPGHDGDRPPTATVPLPASRAAYGSCAWTTTGAPPHLWPPAPGPRSRGRAPCSTSATACCATAAGSPGRAGCASTSTGAAIAADVAALAPLLGEAAALDCVLAGGEEHSPARDVPALPSCRPAGVPWARCGEGQRDQPRRPASSASAAGTTSRVTCQETTEADLREGDRLRRYAGGLGQRLTLPALRHEVQTLSRFGVTPRRPPAP